MRSARICVRGTSLIEVLVVIAIMGLLMSILLPAIQAAREAARRSQCASNLRQFGTALTSFESQYRAFPSAFSVKVKGPLATNPEFQAHSFVADLLPFLEEDAIAANYRRDVIFFDSKNSLAIATPIPVALCPSTPDRETISTSSFMPSLMIKPSDQKKNGLTGPILGAIDAKYSATFKAAVSDYTVPVNVDRRLATELGYKIEDSVRELATMFPLPDSNTMIKRLIPLLVTAGEATLGDRTRAAQITDGLSHTIAMVEVAGRPQHWIRGVRNTLHEPLNSAWADPRILIKIKRADGDLAGRLINEDNNFHGYSFHSTGANVVFADAHVDFLHEDIESRLLLALLTPDQNDNDR